LFSIGVDRSSSQYGQQCTETYYNFLVAITRRELFAGTISLPLLAEPARVLKVVVAGGHPGDPECGCGGTVARYTRLGHQVSLLYLNRGEGFCGGEKLSRCADIRKAEAQRACEILRAQALFADQYDGRAVIDNSHYETFARLLDAEKPDVVFTHWPIDHHRDHRAISVLTLDAWIKSSRKFAMYYYEVAEDTAMFSPTEYVDISSVEAERRAACYAHVSQRPDKWYPKQVGITKSRGLKSGFAQAEAFLCHEGSPHVSLP